jgi:hypothetical protein
MRKIIFALMLILFVVFIQCAASVRIGDIKNTSSRFHNKKVTLTGTVDETLTLPILGVGVYQLNDGTGTIWVKPKQMTAEKGDRIRVSGTIKVGLTISGKSFGLILIESKSEESY